MLVVVLGVDGEGGVDAISDRVEGLVGGYPSTSALFFC